MNWLVNFFQAFAARANRFNVAHICICCSCHLYVYPNFNTKLSKWWKVRNRKRKKTDVKRKFPPKQISKVDEVCLSVCRKIGWSTHSKQLIHTKCSTEIEKATLNILCVIAFLTCYFLKVLNITSKYLRVPLETPLQKSVLKFTNKLGQDIMSKICKRVFVFFNFYFLFTLLSSLSKN